MIELVSTDRCIECNICVKVCPTNVFDAIAGEAPMIARQSDCQTCYLCEAYCPVDALYVAAEAFKRVEVDEETLEGDGRLGSYRKALGWAQGGDPGALIAKTHELRLAVGTGAIG